MSTSGVGVMVSLEGSISCLLWRGENVERWEYAFANSAVHLYSACGVIQQERLKEIMTDPRFDRTRSKSIDEEDLMAGNNWELMRAVKITSGMEDDMDD